MTCIGEVAINCHRDHLCWPSTTVAGVTKSSTEEPREKSVDGGPGRNTCTDAEFVSTAHPPLVHAISLESRHMAARG
jgi:hypothetical protein